MTREPRRTKKAAAEDARLDAFVAAVQALQAEYGLQIVGGFGPHGHDLGVRDTRARSDRARAWPLGETL